MRVKPSRDALPAPIQEPPQAAPAPRLPLPQAPAAAALPLRRRDLAVQEIEASLVMAEFFQLLFRGLPQPFTAAEVEEGTNLILDIARRTHTKEEILRDHPKAPEFILGQALFLYGFGTKIEAEPRMFLEYTRDAIRGLRRRELNQRVVEIFNCPMEQYFRINPAAENKEVEVIVDIIRDAVGREAGRSALLAQCLGSAKEKLRA